MQSTVVAQRVLLCAHLCAMPGTEGGYAGARHGGRLLRRLDGYGTTPSASRCQYDLVYAACIHFHVIGDVRP
eukprot:3425152-Rhodomonas_salina.6